MLSQKVESKSQVQRQGQSNLTICTKATLKASRKVSAKYQCREVENEGVIFPGICVLWWKQMAVYQFMRIMKLQLIFPQTWIDASLTHGRTGAHQAWSPLARGWCWLVTLPCHQVLKWLFQCNLLLWDEGVLRCIFSNHCRAAATQYYLDDILVTAETEQYLQLKNYIKPPLCWERKNHKYLQVIVNNFMGNADGVEI